MSVGSINNKKKQCFCAPLWVSAVGVKKCGQFPHRRSLSNNLHSSCGKPFSPQHSTIHQWLLQSYWAFTRHLHIPDKRNKKHFKATLPAVPTLFHLSNAYKTVREGQMLLRGATAHLLPASAPLKTLLFLLKKENTIHFYIHFPTYYHKRLFCASRPRRDLPPWQASLKVEQETWRKCFLAEPDSQSERMSHLGMMLRKSIQTNCLFEERKQQKRQRKGSAGDLLCCRKLEVSAESGPCPVDWSFE